MANNYVNLPLVSSSSGVVSLNGRTGALTLVAGTGITVTPAGSNITIAATASSALTSAHLLVGNASNIATDVAVSGDLTLANTGAFTVAKIAGTTVSGTTGSTNVVFSASPTLTGTITAAAANFSGFVGLNTVSPLQNLSIGNSILATSPTFSAYTTTRQTQINDLYTNTAAGTQASVMILAQANAASNSTTADTTVVIENAVTSAQTVNYANKIGINAVGYNAGSGTISNIRGGTFSSTHAGSSSASNVIALAGTATVSSTGTATSASGINASTTVSGATTVTTASGTTATMTNSGTATITTAYGTNSTIVNSSTGTLTTAYGIFAGITNSNAGGIITTAYSAYLTKTNSGTITNNFGLYQNDATAKNYFAGNLGIGLNAPSASLQIDAGNATASALKFTAGTTTGQTSTDGVDFGIDTAGNGLMRQREALDLIFYTTNAEVMRLKAAGNIVVPTTVTAGGTTGAQTINKISGTVNFAAAATAITVTNSLVSATSIVMAVVRTNDTTSVIKNVVPASGSFVITLNAAATAETSVGFFVIN